MAAALSSRAFYLGSLRPLEALVEADASYRLARQTGQAATMETSAIWRVNALRDLGRIAESAESGRAAVKELFALGSSQWGCFLAAEAAQALLDLGRWTQCHDILRDALSARRAVIPGAYVRHIAARLASRRGQAADAQQHLDRAIELVPIEFVGLHGREYLVELLVNRGESEGALKLVRQLVKEHLSFVVDGSIDELLLWGARAAADVAERARDRRDAEAEQKATHALDELLAMVEATPPARPELSAEADLIWAAYRAMVVAETGRCRGGDEQAAAWERAALDFKAIGFLWQEAMARWRWAQALQQEGASRTIVAEPLRKAHSIARELGAEPLVAETESLARAARISLTQPGRGQVTAEGQSVLTELTSREREVLAYLVAGRTNAEIAADLFISDKTVSVHVTNLLRKTGTANRVEAASLALRLGLS